MASAAAIDSDSSATTGGGDSSPVSCSAVVGFFRRDPNPVVDPKEIWGQVSRIRDRCYDFLYIFAEIFGETIGVFDSKQS
jgi:hypothetical protein